MICGTIQMLQLYADSWDFHHMVCACIFINAILTLILLFNTGSIAMFGRFRDSVWPTFIHGIMCTGSEESIWQCPHVVYQDSLCRDSSVVCQGIKFNVIIPYSVPGKVLILV